MLTKEQITKNKVKILQLLESTGRNGINKLITFLKQSDYFTAPASSSNGFHGCYHGGLAFHSLSVYELFCAKVTRFGLNVKPDEIAIASLMHDACKIGVYHEEGVLKSGDHEGDPKWIKSDTFPLGHGEKSVYIVQKFIELTETEALLIRWHMGVYDEAWKEFGTFETKVKRICPAITAFHHADNEASKYVD